MFRIRIRPSRVSLTVHEVDRPVGAVGGLVSEHDREESRELLAQLGTTDRSKTEARPGSKPALSSSASPLWRREFHEGD